MYCIVNITFHVVYRLNFISISFFYILRKWSTITTPDKRGLSLSPTFVRIRYFLDPNKSLETDEGSNGLHRFFSVIFESLKICEMESRERLIKKYEL